MTWIQCVTSCTSSAQNGKPLFSWYETANLAGGAATARHLSSTLCAAFPSQATIHPTSHLTSVAIANPGNFRPSQAWRARPLPSAAWSVLCRWSSRGGSPAFVVVVLGDFQNVMDEAPHSNDLFTEWSDRQFTVNGANAGYHLLQSVVHRMLTFWEREWSDCLEELHSTVNTKVRILKYWFCVTPVGLTSVEARRYPQRRNQQPPHVWLIV